MCYIQHFFTLILISLILTGCADSVIPYLKVEDIKIEEELITLQFSEIPNQELFIDAFAFSKDTESISGKCSFNGRIAFFKPIEKIESGHNYIVEVSNTLEDIYGHSLEYEYVHKHSTKTDNNPPSIISISPENESVTKNGDIAPCIVFSETVDRQSLIDALSVSPSVEYFLMWGTEDKSVSIHFESNLAKNTVYTIKISTSLSDLQYNKLLNDFNSHFTYFSPDDDEKDFCYTLYSQEGEKKELSQTEINKLSSKTSFLMDFTNSVSVDSLSSYISMYPSLNFTFYPDWVNSNSLKFELKEKPIWNYQYRLTVKKGISDEFNQQIEEDKYYDIIFSNEEERPVEFLKAFFLASPDKITLDDKWFTITCDTVYSDLNIPVENPSSPSPSEDNEKKLQLYSIFRISEKASTLNIPSIVKNSKISATNACLGIIIDNCRLYTNSEISSSPIYNLAKFTEKDEGWNLVAVCFDLTVTIENSTGLIKFTYNKDIEDDLGNTMTETVVLPYNKT